MMTGRRAFQGATGWRLFGDSGAGTAAGERELLRNFRPNWRE